MTVCIGAIYGDGNNKPGTGVVVAADRMSTWNMTEFERDSPKISVIRDKIVAMIAGDAVRGFNLVRETIAAVAPESPKVDKAAEIASVRYSLLRDRQIEADAFRPRGITRDQFYRQALPGLQQNIAFQLDNHSQTFNYGVDAIIAGVDDTGAHLFQIHNPGSSPLNMEPIGFAAIGSGQMHALQSMIGFSHVPFKTVQETLFAVYVSKRRAEVAPGVGKETDLAIISGTGIAWLGAEKLKKLDELYNEYQKPASKAILDEVAKLTQ